MLLQKGDIIRITKGMQVYTSLPARCFSSELSNELLRRDIRIGEKLFPTGYDTTFLEGEYQVVNTMYDDGGCREDYPHAYHVFAKSKDNPSIEVDFYQNGFSLAVIPDIMPV